MGSVQMTHKQADHVCKAATQELLRVLRQETMRLCMRPPFEALPLLVDSFQGKVPGFAAELDGGEILALIIAHALQHLELYWQAMAVPARHIASPLALQQLVLQHKVLQDLVQGMPCTAEASSEQGFLDHIHSMACTQSATSAQAVRLTMSSCP